MKKGKKITMAEAAAIAMRLRTSIEKRRTETSNVEAARSDLAELEIAFDRCGCAECFDRFERARRTLERMVAHWYHAKESDLE